MAIISAVELSQRYITERFLPDKPSILWMKLLLNYAWKSTVNQGIDEMKEDHAIGDRKKPSKEKTIKKLDQLKKKFLD